MTCKNVNENLDAYIDGALNAPETDMFDTHVTKCTACQKIVTDALYLQGLLREYGDTDVPTPDAAFFDQALVSAAHQGGRLQHRRGWLKGFGTAIAAGVAIWMMGGLFFNSPDIPGADVPVVTMALEEPRTVNLVFASASELAEATLTVTLPDGIEIAGFAGQREISWETSLVVGRNVLPLKLIATSTMGGEVLATLRHDQDDRTFRLHVTVI
jgi:anti-sigma factor RsiW